MSKIFHRIIQGFGKGLNERTAAGRTCLVQEYVINGLVLDFDTFHVLSADIQDTVYIRLKERGGVVVGNRLDLAFVQQKGSLNRGFSIAGRAGMYDLHAFRKLAVVIFNCADCRTKGIPFIVMIKRIQ